MLDNSGSGAVVKYIAKWNGINVIKYKGHILIIMGIFFLDCNETDVFSGTAIERSGVTLMGKIDFIL